MSNSIRNFLIGIAPIALLGLGAQVHAQATDVNCSGCVDTSDIASRAVTTGKIKPRAVTTGKIASSAVTRNKIKRNAVVTSKIRDGAVTVAKVAPELKNAIGTFCLPGETVVGQDASGNFVCGRNAVRNADCVFANGLVWCFDNSVCGEACNDVCASKGLTPVTDNDVWFYGQNTAAKCQVIADALGLNTVNFAAISRGCLEDSIGTHSVGGGLIDPLICSSSTGCPNTHRTVMDQLGIACGTGSRRSVCPCE